MVLQGPPILLRDRIAVHELGGESTDAEVLARRPAQAGGIADHVLEAAATEIETQRGRGVEDDTGPDRAEDELGFAPTADDLDRDAGLGFDPVHDAGAVG